MVNSYFATELSHAPGAERIAGVHTLSELDDDLRDMCLRMEKVGMKCTFEDAQELAKYAGHRPDLAKQPLQRIH
jgi:hypothetical protein